MRTAVTIATLHKGGARLLSGPDIPLGEQRRRFKEFIRGGRAHPEFSAVELYTSGGTGAMRRRLVHPDTAAALAASNVPDPDEGAEEVDPENPAPPAPPAPEPAKAKAPTKAAK